MNKVKAFAQNFFFPTQSACYVHGIKNDMILAALFRSEKEFRLTRISFVVRTSLQELDVVNQPTPHHPSIVLGQTNRLDVILIR